MTASRSPQSAAGKFTPSCGIRTPGRFAVPEFTNAIENDQPVTRVKLTLGPVRSCFIIARR